MEMTYPELKVCVVHRMTSTLLPWSSAYEIEDLPDFPAIAEELAFAGQLAGAYEQRLTFHPSHFVKVAAPTEALLKKSLKELEVHSQARLPSRAKLAVNQEQTCGKQRANLWYIKQQNLWYIWIKLVVHKEQTTTWPDAMCVKPDKHSTYCKNFSQEPFKQTSHAFCTHEYQKRTISCKN